MNNIPDDMVSAEGEKMADAPRQAKRTVIRALVILMMLVLCLMIVANPVLIFLRSLVN